MSDTTTDVQLFLANFLFFAVVLSVFYIECPPVFISIDAAYVEL